MQQLAPNPLRLWEGESHTVRAYLRHWLRRYHYPHEPPRQPADTPFQLDAVGWGKLLTDTADFYEVSLPSQRPKGLATLADVETYVQQHLLKAAA